MFSKRPKETGSLPDDLFYSSEIEDEEHSPEQEEREEASKKTDKNSGKKRTPPKRESNIRSLKETPLAAISNHHWAYELKERGAVVAQGTTRYRFHAKNILRLHTFLRSRKEEQEFALVQKEALLTNSLIDIGMRPELALRNTEANKSIRIETLGHAHALVSYWTKERHWMGKSGWSAFVWSEKEGREVARSQGLQKSRKAAEKITKNILKQQLLDKELGNTGSSRRKQGGNPF